MNFLKQIDTMLPGTMDKKINEEFFIIFYKNTFEK